MFILLFVISIACILAGMAFAGTPLVFLDVPSLLIVFIPSVSMCIASHGKQNFLDIFRCFQSDISTERAIELAQVAHSFGKNVILFGWIGLLIGGVQILHLLKDLEQLSFACAVMLLPILYALCIKALVFQPLADKYHCIGLEKKYTSKS